MTMFVDGAGQSSKGTIMVTQEMTFQGSTAKYDVGNTIYGDGTVRVHLAIMKESDGTFSVIILNLKGCGSCGDTEEDAITNARDAVSETVASYRDDGIEVPWSDMSDYDAIPDGAKLKWIVVNV